MNLHRISHANARTKLKNKIELLFLLHILDIFISYEADK